MNRESYMLRHRQKIAKTGEDTAESVKPLLDSDEQEEVVKSLETEANSQATFFTHIFSGFLLLCAVALVRCFLRLLVGGNEERFPHRAMLERVPDAAFYATYMGHLLGLYLCHRVARGSAWHITPGLMVSWISLFSWLAVFRHFGVTNPLFYWMPLAPAALTAFAVYLFISQKRLERDLEELNRARYNLKGA
eukprot:g1736.t1